VGPRQAVLYVVGTFGEVDPETALEWTFNASAVIALDSSEQNEHKHNDEHDAKDAGGPVPPTAAIAPRWQGAEQEKNQNY
jgi:hypothetical protein